MVLQYLFRLDFGDDKKLINFISESEIMNSYQRKATETIHEQNFYSVSKKEACKEERKEMN